MKRGHHRQGEAVIAVRCPTGKTGFTRGEALRRVERYAVEGNRANVPTRVYECPTCRYWHLTSQPLR